MRLYRLGSLGLLLVLFLNVIPARAAVPSPVAAAARPPAVLLDHADSRGLADLVQSGAQLLADYGAFSLWQLADTPAGSRLGLARLPRAGMRIDLRGLVIDSSAARPEPDLPAGLSSPVQPGETEQFWLVQFAGPLQDAWLDQLRAQGLEITACLPEDACLLWGASPALGVAQLGSLVRWQGAFHPAYRLHPDLRPGGALRSAGGEVEVTIQVLDNPAGQDALRALSSLAASVPAPAHRVINLLDIQARVAVARLDGLASLAAVYNIEPYAPPQKNDEMQDQILAGNIALSSGNTTASGPGYLAWLASIGASSDPADYPILDIVDDGVDSGNVNNILHPDFYAYHDGQPPSSRIQFLKSCLANGSTSGEDGHGNLNAGIAAGYNAQSGFPYHDAAGYSLGLGVSPYGRLASTKIFGDAYDASACDNSYTGIVRRAYAAGARITSNSWGTVGYPYYNAGAQEYDQLTRDADPSTPGNQEMLHIFSAGNGGKYSPPQRSTLGTPGTAKNVMTVGATDLPRDILTSDGNGCNHASSASADNIADYSSRGPTYDGRMKPDLVAPGTHIQGPASQVIPPDVYTGSGICGAASGDQRYYPAGQTLYTWSTGTSHATPAVAGAVQLAWERYFATTHTTPSPAMLKAILLNTPRYLSGVDAGDNLPSPNQGWGMPDLTSTFDSRAHYYYDQHHIFAKSGEIFAFNGTVPDPGKPLHITLAWTDAPGATIGPATVNNLNLRVTIGGITYLGNVFSAGQSAQDGFPDTLNNVENVYLPAGFATGTPFTVEVEAANIAGDGVPGNSDPTDQDFALVLSNAEVQPQPFLSITGVTWQKSAGSINPNSPIEPGQSASLSVNLENAAYGQTATVVQATLQVGSGLASITQPTSAYSDLPPGGVSPNLVPFTLTVSPSQACGSLLQLQLSLDYTFESGGETVQETEILPLPALFTARLRTQTYSYTGSPKTIYDPPPVGQAPPPTILPIYLDFPSPPLRITASVSLTHPRPADLVLSLQRGSGQAVTLASKRGGTASGFDHLIFDDNASLSITTQSNPPAGALLTGTYRPETPLANLLDGSPATGSWALRVSDTKTLNNGSFDSASLSMTYQLCGVLDPPPQLSIASISWQEVPGSSNQDGLLDPGETANLDITLQNNNLSAPATDLTVHLADLSGLLQVIQGTSPYPGIGDGARGANQIQFTVLVLGSHPCGDDLPFKLQASYTYDQGTGSTPGAQALTHFLSCQKEWLPLLKNLSP